MFSRALLFHDETVALQTCLHKILLYNNPKGREGYRRGFFEKRHGPGVALCEICIINIYVTIHCTTFYIRNVWGVPEWAGRLQKSDVKIPWQFY